MLASSFEDWKARAQCCCCSEGEGDLDLGWGLGLGPGSESTGVMPMDHRTNHLRASLHGNFWTLGPMQTAIKKANWIERIFGGKKNAKMSMPMPIMPGSNASLASSSNSSLNHHLAASEESTHRRQRGSLTLRSNTNFIQKQDDE